MTSSPFVVDLASIPTWGEYYRSNRDRIDDALADDPARADIARRFREAIADQQLELDRSLAEKVSIWPGGDLTRLQCDAVVNAANRQLKAGGGICGVIFAAAGLDDLAAACHEIGSCPTGEARITPGFQLPARYIIHAVGPIGPDLDALRATYESVFNVMKENQIRSIGLCCISTGIYRFPNDLAAMIALDAARVWLSSDDNAQAADRIVFSTFLKQDTGLYECFMPIAFPCPDELEPDMEMDADPIAEPRRDSEQTPIQALEAEAAAELGPGAANLEIEQDVAEPSYATEQKPAMAAVSHPDAGQESEEHVDDDAERT